MEKLHTQDSEKVCLEYKLLFKFAFEKHSTTQFSKSLHLQRRMYLSDFLSFCQKSEILDGSCTKEDAQVAFTLSFATQIECNQLPFLKPMDFIEAVSRLAEKCFPMIPLAVKTKKPEPSFQMKLDSLFSRILKSTGPKWLQDSIFSAKNLKLIKKH